MGSRKLGGKSRLRKASGIASGVLLVGWTVACGADREEDARVPSMLGSAQVAPAAAEGSDEARRPAIESIAIHPRRPVAGGRLKATAHFAPGAGGRADVTYQWRSGTGRVLGEGRELDTRGLEPGTTVEVLATPAGEEPGEVFAHRFKLADPAKQIALVAIDAPEGRSVGSVLRAVVETTDENDGFDVAALEWRVGGETVGEGEELDTSAFAPGDVVELRARLEGEGERPIPAQPIVLERSAPPEIRSTPTAAIEGGRFHYAIEASSPARGAKLRYELLKGPQGMTVDASTGVVEWRPGASQRGRFDVEVAVMDQWGSGAAQRFGLHADGKPASPASPAPPAAPR